MKMAKSNEKTKGLRKIAAYVLTFGLLLSCFAVFGGVSASAETGYDRGYDRSMAGSGKIVAEGLDVSEWQGALSNVGTIDFIDIKKRAIRT